MKNVRYLGLTRQIRDYMEYAQLNGLRFDLYVQGGSTPTSLSKALQAAKASGAINVLPIP